MPVPKLVCEVAHACDFASFVDGGTPSTLEVLFRGRSSVLSHLKKGI
jgi:hypothetical protein